MSIWGLPTGFFCFVSLILKGYVMPDIQSKRTRSNAFTTERQSAWLCYSVRCILVLWLCLVATIVVNATALGVAIYCEFTSLERERDPVSGAFHALAESVSNSLINPIFWVGGLGWSSFLAVSAVEAGIGTVLICGCLEISRSKNKWTKKSNIRTLRLPT